MTISQFFTAVHPFDTDVDISSDAFWALPYRVRDQSFAKLRAQAPVSWHPPMLGHGFEHDEAGFWAVVKADDIRQVSLNHEVFRSGIGGTTDVRPMPFPRSNLVTSDPPLHKKLRKRLSSAFTPAAITRLSEKITRRAGDIVDRAVGAGDVDFVAQVSSQLPMLTIADMFGIPDELIPEFTAAGERIANAGDPEVRGGAATGDFLAEQFDVLRRIGAEVVGYRRRHPAEDLATALGQPDAEGHLLTDDEIGQTTGLLSGAGNDTTKQTTSWGVYQLWHDPAQKRWLAEDYDARIGGAVEELVRHCSPVALMARTAAEDTELGGRHIARHDKVVMYYCSGNRDEEVFDDPWRFDLSRPVTPQHLGFGGGGIHYCLGNAVAKTQLRALFREFLTKLPDMHVGEPEFGRSEKFHSIRRLPVHIPAPRTARPA